jgi:hypothetical protein
VIVGFVDIGGMLTITVEAIVKFIDIGGMLTIIV